MRKQPENGAKVDVLLGCKLDVQPVIEVLASLNIQLDPNAAMRLVLVADYLQAMPPSDDRPMLLANLIGQTIQIGPLFKTGNSPCPRCLAWWIRNHRWLRPPMAQTQARPKLAAELLVSELAIILSTGSHPRLEASLMTYDTHTLQQQWHAINAAPDCDRCPPGTSPDLHRFVSNVTGVVTRFDAAKTFENLHHARAHFVYPVSNSPKARVVMKPAFAYGSGETRQAAETRAIAEALERYSLCWRGDETTHHAFIGDPNVLHPNSVLQYSGTQYRTRLQWNETHDDPFEVCEPTLPGTRVACVEAKNLDQSKGSLLVPAGLVYFAWPYQDEPLYANADTIGCAAGETIEDALLGAILELIERDAVAIWWCNRLVRPEINPSHFADPKIDRIIEALTVEGRRPQLLDITTDIGVPVYAAVAPTAGSSQMVYAAAASVSPHIAARKAFLELAQFRQWQGASAVGDWLHPSGALDLRPPCPDTAITALSAAGIDCWWIDMTRPEIGVPVVRAIAPGLRHPWSRFAPGRLFDVPVRMGWRTTPMREVDCNPVDCWL